MFASPGSENGQKPLSGPPWPWPLLSQVTPVAFPYLGCKTHKQPVSTTHLCFSAGCLALPSGQLVALREMSRRRSCGKDGLGLLTSAPKESVTRETQTGQPPAGGVPSGNESQTRREFE